MNVMQFFRDGTRPVRPKRPSRFNWPVFWIGQAWFFVETWHFGWNMAPSSDAELICDGIGVLICVLSWRPVNG